jgi:hypothetical protein
MGAVAHLYDPEGDDLIRRAEAAGGAENLSEGERWRLQNTLDRRRRLEAQAKALSGRTDALSSQVVERRFAALEAHMRWADGMLDGLVWPVVGQVIAEAEERAGVDARKALEEVRGEIHAKIDALFGGFETAVAQLRGEDRTALLESVRETLGDAEVRIDSGLAKALEAEKERNTIELALTRDELLSVISEKTYAQFSDDAPKLELAEKAIASLRKRITSLEEESARQAARGDQFAGMAASLATLEDAYRPIDQELADPLRRESPRCAEGNRARQ